MGELIKITTNDNGQKLVSAKELFLGLGMDIKKWSRWREANIESNDFFKENEDWVVITIGGTTEKGGQVGKDYAISLEFAKHLAMQARTEKSHEYRNYFIQCEKVALAITEKDRLLLGLFSQDKMTVAESHKKLVEIEVKEATTPLLNKIEEDKPMVEFSNTVLKSSDNILIRELAKIACDEGIKIGQNKLYEKLREWGYIFKNSTEPYQRYVENGYFVVKETTSKTPYGVKLNQTTLCTPLGQIKIIEKLRKELAN